MNRTRFLTSSLATVAVSAAITLAAPPANAADAAQQCGQPAVTQAHPAITHSEWLWQYTRVDQAAYTSTDYQRVSAEYSYTDYLFTRVSREYSKVTQEAYTEYEWQRWIEETQEQWHYENGDLITPAQEAVYETLYLYTNKPKSGGENGQEERWYADGAQPGGFIKVVPEQSKQVLISEAVDPVYGPDVWVVDEEAIPAHWEVYPTYQTEAPEGDGWVKTGNQTDHPAQTDVQWSYVPLAGYTATGNAAEPETVTNQTGTAPGGEGWSLTSSTPHTDWFYVAPDTSVNAWAPTGNEAEPELFSTDSSGTGPTGLGWVETGTHPVDAETSIVKTQTPSAEAPDGDHDWSKVAGSLATVTDKAAWTETVTPATDPCPVDDGGDGGVTAPVQHREEVLGEGQPAPVAPQAAPQAAVAAPHSVLPNTGSGASLGITLAGVGSLAAGAVLMLASRRRRFGLD
jgi:LPXTG-motif cell wall-anchored protein